MSDKKAFTVIELIIVITVAVILMAIGLPGINGMMVSARIAQAKSEMKKIQTALESYYLHSLPNAYPPGWNQWTGATTMQHDYLISAMPPVIQIPLNDALSPTPQEYGYIVSPAGAFYAVLSVGPNGVIESDSIDDTGAVSLPGDDICVTNGTVPTLQQQQQLPLL